MVDWVRLWHDMPTDPKWRVIARKSGQPLANVIALFTLLMTTASAADERGSIAQFSAEDAAAALDLDEEDVQAILSAMEGRVVENQRLSGWERRQPKREDAGASERKQRFKERSGTHENAPERIGTHENASERPREETDTDTEQNILAPKGACPPKADALPVQEAFDRWNELAVRHKLPVAKGLNANRRKHIRARLAQAGLPGWLEALAAVESSPLCLGQNERGWRADLDFVCQPKSFDKLREGSYAPKPSATASPSGVSASSELLARHNALMNRKAAA